MPDARFEIQHAARTLRRNPSFTLAAMAALSLGVAANTAVFSVVNKVLLEPLPYPEPHQLVQLMTESELGDQDVVSIPKFEIWRTQSGLFQSIAAYDTGGPDVNLTEGGYPQPLPAARVSAGFFRTVGVEAIVGRTFADADDQADAPLVALISQNLWQRRFGAQPELIGRTISVDQQRCKVIGIVSSTFTIGEPVDVWLPLQPDRFSNDHIGRVRVAARLQPGVTVRMAAQGIAATSDAFVKKNPSAPMLFLESFTAIPLRDAFVGDVRPALFLLTGAVAFVLLIACSNAASLVLARSSRRASEIAVRSALGAGRATLLRQLFTESVLLSLAAGVAGLFLGFWGVRGLLAISPVDLPRVGANGSAITLDWKVFLFTLAVTLLSGLLFGLLPAIKASRADLISLVKDNSLESGMNFRRGKGRSLLIVAQVALTLVLLIGAGLLIRTFLATRISDRGFDYRCVLTVPMSMAGPQFEHTEQVAQFVERTTEHLISVPGISAVATTSSLPLERSLLLPFTIVRHDQTRVGRYHGVAAWRSVSPAYFDTLRIRLLAGRFFTEEDNARSDQVALVNRVMTRKFWPEKDANPIGQFIVIGKGIGPGLEDRPRLVIGVVADIREAGFDREPAIYVPVAQLTNQMTARNAHVLPMNWLIRTSDAQTAGNIEKHLRDASGGLPLGRVRTMQQVTAVSSARSEFYALLLSVFAAMALLLASVGLYSIMTYSVQQRTREIGLRMALGANPHDVRNMVIWQGVKLALAGIAIGVPAAFALSRVLISLIFGVHPWDPIVFAAVAILLTGVGLTAAYLPSLRASRINPSESLRVG